MSEQRRDHQTLSWTDYRGKKQERRVNLTLDVRDFVGTPGYSLLVVAANTGLSVSVIEDYLDVIARETPGVSRTPNWIQKRRWLFQQPGTRNPKGSRANLDGTQGRAVALMGRHPEMSLRNLRLLLREHGIERSTEWIRQHRLDATASTVSP